jgi:iron(III) transport system ATP-binding protein
VQRGTPQDIYSGPASRFVADFIGSANFLLGSVAQEAGVDGLVGVATKHGILRCRFAQAPSVGQKVVVTARPEDLVLYAEPPAAAPSGEALNLLAGTVTGRVFLGEVTDYTVDVGDAELRIRARPEASFRVRQSVHIGVAPQKCVGLAA